MRKSYISRRLWKTMNKFILLYPYAFRFPNSGSIWMMFMLTFYTMLCNLMHQIVTSRFEFKFLIDTSFLFNKKRDKATAQM